MAARSGAHSRLLAWVIYDGRLSLPIYRELRRTEMEQVALGLQVQNERGLPTRGRDLEAGLQESGDLAAERTEIEAAVTKARPDQLRQGEYVLAISHGGEQVVLETLAVGEQPLPMTARADLAGVGQELLVPALIAADAWEAVMRAAAGR